MATNTELADILQERSQSEDETDTQRKTKGGHEKKGIIYKEPKIY